MLLILIASELVATVEPCEEEPWRSRLLEVSFQKGIVALSQNTLNHMHWILTLIEINILLRVWHSIMIHC